MNMKPRSIVIATSLAMAATSMSATAASSYADQISGSGFGTSNNNMSQSQNQSNINVSTQAFAGAVQGKQRLKKRSMQQAYQASQLSIQRVLIKISKLKI